MATSAYETSVAPVKSPVTAPSDRLTSLDLFRGVTIAAMILVNNPGNEHAYWPLEHAEWNGWTPTDLIFPFFLFIVGVSLVFSFQSRLGRRRFPRLTLAPYLPPRYHDLRLLG